MRAVIVLAAVGRESTNHSQNEEMASAVTTAAGLSSASGQPMVVTTVKGRNCPGDQGCRGQFVESILKYSKALPVVELFETFMICGFGLLMMSLALYFSFGSVAKMYKTEGMTLAEASNIAANMQNTFVAWMAIGGLILLLGIVLYYVHRAYM